MCNLHVAKAKWKPLISDVQTGARSLVGEKQPAEVARSRLARNTRPLLMAQCGLRLMRNFSGNYGKVSGAVQRECRFLRVRAKECDSDADNCEFSLLQHLRVGCLFSEVLKGSLPLSETLSLRALHLSLLELPGVLLERVFPSTLFLSECRCVAVENLTSMNCGSK